MIPQPIEQVPLFLRLSDGERELVTARLRRRQAASGELIFTEGRPSEAMYVITSGRVKLEGGSVDSALTLANLGAGSLLGEEDMLLDRPYSTSARAAAVTQLYVLSRSDLEELVGQRPAIGLKFSAALGLRIPFLDQYLIHQRLRNIELLSALSQEDLRAIGERLDFHSVARGDMIIEAGAPGETAFFIEEGKARMISKTHEGDSFDELGEGALFGHTSLVTGKPYPATVRAVTDVTLWALSRTVYQDLITDHPAIKLAFSRALAESLSSSDQNDAMERMRQLQLFSDVPTEALNTIASRLVLRHYLTDEAIYTEGTPGDAMYVVESGQVRLMDSAFADAHLLERMRAGDSFGEMALLTGRTRAECARAATDTTLWVLYKNDFDEVMVQFPEISVSLSRALTERLGSRESDFVVRHLRRIDLFSNLATSELQAISKKVRGLRFRPGEIICFAGQPAQTLYMIEMGEIKRTGAGPSGEPVTLDLLGPGESLGVQSIIQNIPHTTTAQAIGEVELWTISKSDFQSMMETYPALAITITRMMADQLMRTQRFQQPPAPGQPRGGIAPPTRGPTGKLRPAAPRPNASAPLPGARIQRPPSGARPIKPAPNTPTAPIKGTPRGNTSQSAETPAPPSASFASTSAPGDKNSAQDRPHLPHLQAPHVPTPHLPHVEPPHIEAPHIPAPHMPQVQAPHISRPQLPHVQAPHIPKPQIPRVQAPHLQAPHVSAPRLPHFQAPRKQTAPGGGTNFFSEFGGWIAGLSWGARFRVLITGALIVWIAFIAFPITTVTTVSSAVAGLQLSNQPSQPVQLIRGPATGNGKLKVAYAVESPTPFPTRTPQPTATPKPKVIAAAPVKRPPTPTAAPTASPAPVIPALAAVDWDPRLGSGPQGLPRLENVRIVPATVASGQQFWRVIKVKWQNIDESGNDHTIYVKILGADGKRVDGQKLQVTSDTSKEVFPDQPTEKSSSDMCQCNYSYPLYGDGYNVQIVGSQPSDMVAGMLMPEHRHVNYIITYQLTTNP